MEQQVFYSNQIDALKTQLSGFNPEKTFLVRGQKSYSRSGSEAFINTLFPNSDLTAFSNFDPNPQLSDLIKGIELFKAGNFENIIAIGGGSVIDMAKLISVFAHQSENIEEIILGKTNIEHKKTPLLAIPTTAGTGAEATHFAVLYIHKNKYSVAHSAILPDTVYLSSEFSLTASTYLTACTGLDAFSQAIESVWSVNATEESEDYALEAIKIVWEHLEKATQNHKAAKEHMQRAAFLAGKAINITKTTAPHAISYAFTSYYNIPHGHAVSLSLPYFLNYNYQLTNNDCTDSRGAEHVRARIDKILNIFGCGIDQSEKTLVRFFNKLNISIDIDKLIKNFDEKIIAENVNVERLSNNPRMVSKQAIELLLRTKI